MALPVISVTSASRNEGNSGDGNLTFTVKLNQAASTPVLGSDYTAKSGTLTIAAGATSYEANESFSLKLSAPSGATLAGGGATLAATGTIKNDDAAPMASIAGPAVAEAHVGTADAVFTITLSKMSAIPTTISYTTVDGTARAGEDYTATSGTLVIPTWTKTAAIPVSVSGDVVHEADESFSLVLSAATATIINDDAGGTITRVSTSSRGAEANQDSSRAVFSPDGRKIAFVSLASNLVSGNTNGTSDVFGKDLVSGAVTRVSTTGRRLRLCRRVRIRLQRRRAAGAARSASPPARP